MEGDVVINRRIITSSRKDVKGFLQEMKALLSGVDFDIDKDFELLLKKRKDDPCSPYTTENTLLALDYDRTDVVNELMTLSIKDYYQTQIDEKAEEWAYFFVFGKRIQEKDVYIRVRIREGAHRRVFCISFHFAQFPMVNFPYAC